MTQQVKMPEPAAYRFAKSGINNGYHYTEDMAGEEDRFLKLWKPLITTDQAEAYKDACVREVLEWQPIETAPANELILVGPTKRMGICVAMNDSREGWVTETCGEWANIYTPTHWMPLPAPPHQ